MLKRLKKTAAVCLAALLTAALTGCNATVSLYAYYSGEDAVQVVELSLPDSARKKIEDTAAVNPNHKPERWSLASWLKTLSFATDYAYDSVSPGSVYAVRFTRTLPSGDGGEQEGERDPNVGTRRKNYFWFYSVEVTEENPFNGLRQAYDNPEAGTLTELIVKGGWVTANGYRQYLAPLTEAFPALQGVDPSGLKLDLYLALSGKVDSTGTSVVVDGIRFSKFERYFDDSKKYVTYRYFVPNSLGWNVTALFAAAVVVTVILLVTRKSKPKPDEPDAPAKFNY